MYLEDSKLSIYPISAGNELNVFAEENILHIRILNMRGELVLTQNCNNQPHCIIDIKSLPSATYFAEVLIEAIKPIRTVFVKL